MRQHRLTHTAEYTAWQNMKSRCLNPNFTDYAYYGGRGIKICDRWLNSPQNFLADMGKKPGPEYSINRIDNNGDYTPNNCEWATATEQAANRRPRLGGMSAEELARINEVVLQCMP